MDNTPVGIRAEYIGPALYSYEIPKYKNVIVYLIYDSYEQREMGWVYERIMIQDNSFVFTIKHSPFTCELTIPVLINTPSEIHALYLGPPILVGTKYNTDKLYVDLLLKDGTIKVLKFGEYTVSDVLVKQPKNNIYELNYAGLTDKFFVYGYHIKDSIDLDFQIFIIHDNGYEEDVTDILYEGFYEPTIDKVYVTINKLDKLLFAANYRVLMPKNCGMYQKYATEWLVIKDNSKINATLNKVFYKEDYYE